MHHGAGEINRLGIAVLGQTRNDGTARIPQPQRLGDLVEGLAHGIVQRLAQYLVIAPRADMHQHGMAARNQRKDKRRLQVGCCQQVGVQMAFQMVDGNKRLARGKCEALCKGNAHNQRTNQTGTLRNTNGDELAGGNRICQSQRGSSFLERGIDHAHDYLDVLARGDLRHNAAKARMEVNLR